jgi:DNA processing protein
VPVNTALDTRDLRAWLRLSLTAGIGNEAARRLLAAFGSAQSVFEQPASAVSQVGGDKLVRLLPTEPPQLAAQLQLTIEWLEAGVDRRVVTLGDEGYPAGLLNIEDPPLMLYMMGSLAASDPATPDPALRFAIVGSRNPTPQGEANARQFAKALAESGLCIVSGMALGVDGAAHDGALQGDGTTIAVVGTGLDRVYPKKHLALAHRIAENGMIVSEFPLGTPPLMSNFPRRNRIISALSQGTLVVEAALKSGSLITARLAVEQGKDVFAIPGSIHSPQSRGCHALIKQGAKLVETAQDILEELRIPFDAIADASAEEDEASEDCHGGSSPESAVMAALGFDITSLDALQARTGMATAQLQAELLGLELDGHVVRLPGGLFQRMATA